MCACSGRCVFGFNCLVSRHRPSPSLPNCLKMYRFNHLNIKQEYDDDMNEDGNDNIQGLPHEINKGLSVNHVTASVLISTHPQPSQQSVQSCTKIKKEEEGCEIVKLEWDGDECECRVEREIKTEFNQTDATENAHINFCLGPSDDKKGVKKEEEEDGTMVKIIQRGTKGGKDEQNGEYIGEEVSKSDVVQEDRNGKISDESEDNEIEINDEKYEIKVDCEQSIDDEEAEVYEESDRELQSKSPRNNNKSQKGNNVCKQCGKAFTKPYHLSRHIQTQPFHRDFSRRPFKCSWEGCNKTFVNKRNMTRHLPIHTGYQLELTVHIRAHTSERPFACPWEECRETFARKDNMQRHLQIHTGEVPKSHVCEHCEKRFRDSSKLTRHIRTHTGERPFACLWNGCNKTFARNDKMQLHYKSHTGQLPHACEQCDKRFRFPFKLVEHIRACHTGERPYKCDRPNCDRDFVTAHTLKMHQLVHSDERSFVCHLNGCTMKYKHKETLVHHQKTKHN